MATKPRSRSNAGTLALVVAVFQQPQPAIRLEHSRGLGDDRAQIGQAIRAGQQRRRRLEAQLAFKPVRVGGGDVRRIAGDQRAAFVAQRRAPVALAKFDIGDLQTAGHCVGRRSRRLGCDRGDDPGARSLAGQGQRDSSAAGAEIGESERAIGRQPLQGQFHQPFGVRAGDEEYRA